MNSWITLSLPMEPNRELSHFGYRPTLYRLITTCDWQDPPWNRQVRHNATQGTYDAHNQLCIHNRDRLQKMDTHPIEKGANRTSKAFPSQWPTRARLHEHTCPGTKDNKRQLIIGDPDRSIIQDHFTHSKFKSNGQRITRQFFLTVGSYNTEYPPTYCRAMAHSSGVFKTIWHIFGLKHLTTIIYNL